MNLTKTAQSAAAPTLLIVWHSRTGAAEAMARAAFEGARDTDGQARARLLAAQDVTPEILLAAAGYLFACPENLGTMSGVMKDMFDRTYYPLLGQVEGRPYASMIAAGSDGRGAEGQLDRIVTGWRLRRVSPGFIANFNADRPETILATKRLAPAVAAQCVELGALLAEGLSLGAF